MDANSPSTPLDSLRSSPIDLNPAVDDSANFLRVTATSKGGNGGDRLLGGDGDDKLIGKGGNDTLQGKDGNDILQGGSGKDKLRGDVGNDRLGGGHDHDILKGGKGDDSLQGNAGNDRMVGQADNDSLLGGSGSDRLVGGSGNDTLRGQQDNDILKGNSGSDQLQGEDGNDTLLGGAENDVLDGGSGSDRLDGGTGSDRLTGGEGADVFVLNAGQGGDIITDFEGGIDALELGGGMRLDDLTITGSGANTLITLAATGETLVTLIGVSIGPITPVPTDDAITLWEGETATTLVGGLSSVLDNDVAAVEQETITFYQNGQVVTFGGTRPQTTLAVNPTIIGPTYGKLTLNPDGTFVYQSFGDEVISDQFIYEALSDDGRTAAATVTIGITPVNDVPVLEINRGAIALVGKSVVLDSSMLSATDAESSADAIEFQVSTPPGHGQLERVSAPGVAITSFTQSEIDQGLIQYVNGGGSSTLDRFQFRLSDGEDHSTLLQFSLLIDVSSQLPTLDLDVDDSSGVTNGNTRVTFTEGGGAVAIATDVNITDTDSTTADSVTIILSTRPDGSAESLLVNGGLPTGITITDPYDNADGRLVLSGTASIAAYEAAIAQVHYLNASTTPTIGNRTITVVANDGENDGNTVTSTVTVVERNDGPTLDTNAGLTVTEGLSSLISSSVLSASDSDDTPAGLTYTLTSIPNNGRLELTTSPGSAIASFTQDDVNNNRVVYIHNNSETTTDSIGFTLADGGEDGAASVNGTLTVTITPVNDSPAIATNTDISVTESGFVTVTTSNLNANDPDDAGTGLTYTVTASPSEGQLELSTAPGTPISSFTQDDLENNRVVYVHTGGEATTDGFTVSLADGGEDGAAADTATIAITVLPANDAPVLDNSGTLTLTTVVQNATNPSGDLVATLLASGGGSPITDDDTGAVDGIAVTAVNDTNGSWEYSTNGGLNWTAFGAVSEASAVVLRATGGDRIRFVPTFGFTGTDDPGITFRAWDTTDGLLSGSTGVDTTTNGGITPFSTAVETASVTVSPLNNAPVFTGLDAAPDYTEDTPPIFIDSSVTVADLELDALNGGNGNYSGAILTVTNSSGTPDPDELFSFATMINVTVNGMALEVGGLAIATFTNTGGTLEITFTDANSIPTTALVNEVLQAIQYANISDNPGLSTEIELTFNDGNTGSQGAGGAGSDFGTVIINLFSGNDAPVLDNSSTMTLTDVDEDATDPLGDTVASILATSGISDPITDVDGGDPEGMAVTSVDNTNGTWQFSTNGGSSWTPFGTIPAGSALTLGTSARVRFVPNPDFAGTVTDGITFHAWDQSNGSLSGALANDALSTGGGTAYSTATETASVTITPINDAPTFTGLDNTPTFTEDTSAVVLDDNAVIYDAELDALNSGTGNYAGTSLTLERNGGANSDDILSFAFMPNVTVNGTDLEVGGNAIASFSTTGGTLTLTFTDSNGSIPTTAHVNEILNAIQYSNSNDNPPGTVTLDFTVNDGNVADSQGSGGVETGSGSITVTITPQNDAPVLASAAAGNLSYTEGNSATAISPSGLGVSDVDDTTIESAVISISGNYQTGEDILSVIGTLPTGISAGAFDVGSGSLTLTGSASLANYTTALQQIGYENTSGNPDPSTRTVSFTVNDGDDDSNTITRDITVNQVNDAPTLDNTGTMSLTSITEDDTNPIGDLVSAIIASAGGDRITDPDTGAIEGIAITALDTTNGTWEFSVDGGTNWAVFPGVSATNALVLRASDRVRFIPDLNFNGTVTDGLTFHAWDTSDGTTPGTRTNPTPNGGTSAFSTNTEAADIVVTAVNDAPAFIGLDNTPVFTEEGVPVVLDGDMTISDVELDALNGGDGDYRGVTFFVRRDPVQNSEDVFSFAPMPNVTVNGSSLEVGGQEVATILMDTGGWLSLGFSPVSVVTPTTALVNEILQAIQYSNSSDTPPASVPLIFSFDDGNAGSQGSGGALQAIGNIAVTITAVNDLPVLAATEAGTLAYAENDGAVAISPSGLGITDVDDTDIESATIQISSNYQVGEDVLSATASLPGSIVVDSFDAGTGTLTLTGTVSLSDYTAALQLIGYENTSDSPNTSTRTITFTVNDGDDSSNTVTRDITITPLNDAPVLDATGTMTLTTIDEDDANPAGDLVSTIITSAGGDRLTDVDAGAIEGIAVTAVDTTNGTWEFSVDGGTNWTAFTGVSDSTATVLGASDLIRFVPNANFNGAVTNGITFRAWDTTDGSSSGNTVDASTHGGTTAFSTATETADISVNAVNDAPVLDTTGTMTLTTIDEDDTNSSGDLVSALIASAGGDRLSDVDAGAIEGIAITTIDTTNGTWEFSVDGGTNWSALTGVSATNALVLRDSDRVRFVPTAHFNGTVTNGLTFHAWDTSDGTPPGTTTEPTPGGGTSAFSIDTETADITVNAVNDAPVLDTSGNMVFTEVNKDNTDPLGESVATLIASAGGDRITDVDLGAVEGIAVTAVDDTNGTWQFSTDSGTSWIAFGSVSSSSAVVLNDSALIRFLPDGVFDGMIDPGMTFHAWDASDGFASGTAGVNASTPGGTSAFSAATETASIDVVLESAPIATDDTYHVLVTNTLSKATGDADDLLDNDDLGSPDLGAIATFGGGSLGGSVSDNSFGASVSLAGGTLTVNDDGSFSLTNPTTTGDYTFDYQVSNTIGNDIGTVSIQVRETPVAVNDTVTSTSSPGDTYHTPLDTLLSVPDGTTDLLTNDTIGFPVASLTLFGVSTADTTVGTAGATANGGSLTVNGDGSFNYTPPSPSGGVSFTGTDTFVYQLDNGVVAPSTATVTLAVGDRPTAVDDAYTSIGNIVMTIDSVNGVLGNDAGDEITLTRFDGDADTTDGKTVDGIETITTSNGSTVLLNTDGSFIFTPATGFTGTDTFYYTMGNGFGTQTGQVDITIDDIVWFIDNSEAVNGDGSEDSPFNSLGAFEAVNDGTGSPGTGDYIYIAGTGTNYTHGLTLQDNQVLIGEGTPGTFQPFLESLTGRTYDGALGGGDGLPTLGGANPILENTQAGGNGITLATDNQIYGITIGNTGNTNDGVGISGNNFGTLILRDTIITDNGRLLDLSTGTLDAEFDELTSLSSSGGAAVRLDAVSTTGSHLQVSSTGLGTRISNASGGLDIQNSGSGSMFNFGHTEISDSGAGVNLLNNTGASFTFGTLNITENTSGSGIVASGGGTITTAQGNISVKGGSALDLDGIATNLNLNAVTTSNRITAIGIVFTDTSGSIDLGAVSVSDSTPIAANAIQINNSTADVTIGNINIGNIGTDAVVLNTYSGNFAINGGSIEDVVGTAILGSSVAGTFNVTETSILNATTGLSLSTDTVGSPTLVANIINTDFGASGQFIEETGIIITANGDSTVQLTLNGDGQNFQIITNGFETTDNGIVIHANDTSTVTFDLNEYYIRTDGTGVVLNQVAGTHYILPGYSGASSGDLSGAIATYLTNAGGQNNDLSTAATQVDAQSMTNVTG